MTDATFSQDGKMLLWIAETLINFVSGSATTLDDIITILGGIVSIAIADLISEAFVIFTISVVVTCLKLNDKESFSLFSRVCSLDWESVRSFKSNPSPSLPVMCLSIFMQKSFSILDMSFHQLYSCNL